MEPAWQCQATGGTKSRQRQEHFVAGVLGVAAIARAGSLV